MRLRIRQGDRVFVVEAPEGSALVASEGGGRVLVIPAPSLMESAVGVAAEAIIPAARVGMHRLRLLAVERRPMPARPA